MSARRDAIMPGGIPSFLVLNEAAERLRMSPRQLRDFLKSHPVGRRAGRTILLTELDLEAIINAMEGRSLEPNPVYVDREIRWRKPALTIDPSRTGAVYFIKSGEYVKIGVAINVAQRLAALQVAHPEDLDLLLEIPGGPAEEAVLHTRFAAYRVRGEWFRLSDEIRAYIQSQRNGVQ